MTRPTSVDARDRLLDAGLKEFLELLDKGVATSASDHLDLKSVAERAGYRGPGMIYNAFPSTETQKTREVFIDALMDHIVDEASPDFGTIEVLHQLVEAGIPANELIRLGTRLSWDEAFLDGSTPALLGLAAALPRNSRQRERFREIEIQRQEVFGALFGEFRSAYGRDPKEGFDGNLATVIVRALLIGLAQAVDTSPELDPGDIEWEGTEGWNLAGIVARELLFAFSTPVDDSATPFDQRNASDV